MSNSNFVLSIVVASACLMSCTDKTTIVQKIVGGDQVHLRGEVLGWLCEIGDVMNNTESEHRFGVLVGDTARILIGYANGWCDTVLTDSASRFHRIVGAGLHTLTLETRYSLPLTYQVYLEKDTDITLNMVFLVLNPDNVSSNFRYDSAADTVGAAQEWQALQRLNGRIHGALKVSGSVPQTSWRTVYLETSVYWDIPLVSRTFNVIQVSSQADSIAVADTAHLISPTYFRVWPTGIYPCLF